MEEKTQPSMSVSAFKTPAVWALGLEIYMSEPKGVQRVARAFQKAVQWNRHRTCAESESLRHQEISSICVYDK